MPVLLRPAALALAVLIATLAAAHAHAAIESRDVLKTYFETGDIPTQNDFIDLIDSVLDVTWTYDTQTVHTLAAVDPQGGVAAGADGRVIILLPGQTLQPGVTFAPSALIDSTLNLPDDRYLIGLRIAVHNLGLPDPTLHYAFIDATVDGPGSPTQGAIHIHGFAYESDPDTPLTVFYIPEPAAAALLLTALPLLPRRPRRRPLKRPAPNPSP